MAQGLLRQPAMNSWFAASKSVVASTFTTRTWLTSCRARAAQAWRVVVLLACAQATGVQAQGPAAESPTLRKIRETGVVTLGYRVSSVPFSYLDARRRPIGYSIDICERVVDAIRQRLGQPGIEARLVQVTSATRVPMLANGTVDLECGVTTNTAERQKSVAFSTTTFVAASRLLSRTSANIRGITDLRGQTVATTVSTTSMQLLTALNQSRGLDMKILAGADDVDSFQMVRTGRAAAFAMDDVLLRSVLATTPDAKEYSIADEALSVEPYAIGMSRDDPAFKQLVDGVIVDLFRRGQIHAIYRKWFESPLPHLDINLRLPMSDSLQRVIARPTDSPDPVVYR